MRSFDIPIQFLSPLISKVKERRQELDPRKTDFSPTTLDFGAVRIQLARHFGFCFGVENAIEISFKAIAENPNKKIFLLSQMIHNPEVNEDLESRGVVFLHDTNGVEITPFSELKSDDVVIVPAFGTTLEMESKLKEIGVDIVKYNTTCPFVERVWKRSSKLGAENFTVVIHGKPDHEETRATFSHAASTGNAIIVANFEEAEFLAKILSSVEFIEEMSVEIIKKFWSVFKGRTTENFDPKIHLKNLGVVNQTTMIASETQAIAELIKSTVPDDRFANTRDTLCYATNDNQRATRGALESGEADVAIVVGGYNSSNTSHIVEICNKVMPTFFVRNELEFKQDGSVEHFDVSTREMKTTDKFLCDLLPKSNDVPTVLVTSGASCPDASLERVLLKVLAAFDCGKGEVKDVEDVLKTWVK